MRRVYIGYKYGEPWVAAGLSSCHLANNINPALAELPEQTGGISDENPLYAMEIQAAERG